MKNWLLGVASLVVLAGCTSPDTDVAGVSTSAPATTSSTTSTILETVENGESAELVPSTVIGVELRSPGTITIDGTAHTFAFECWAAGVGDVLALGVGTGDTDPGTQAVVQEFFGMPYVAIQFADGSVQELAIDRPAELFLQGNEIRGSALRFVNSSGTSGVGDALGLGDVTVSCEGFVPGLPEGWVAG
jgi:hypothetical protein